MVWHLSKATQTSDGRTARLTRPASFCLLFLAYLLAYRDQHAWITNAESAALAL